MKHQTRAWLKSLTPLCPLNVFKNRGNWTEKANNQKTYIPLILVGEFTCAKH
ncbi:MAG: hypothetical protein Q8L85_03450 [Alphaproteobacteria bacterium]|nr:hypothetical protein [Alphaproteobacteria bacterium]